MLNKFLIFFLLSLFGEAIAQTDSSYVAIDSVATDSILAETPINMILNDNAIFRFYQNLALLETKRDRKINIVHIGDSHIQADLMTAKIRTLLQQKFGNGGRGFVFPHTLAKTNGSSDIRFSSNATWESRRNIYPPDGSLVGLSGIALSSATRDFAMEIIAKQSDGEFNTIRVITPENKHDFDFSLDRKTVVTEIEVPKKIIHKIKSGEALSIIADKYNVSIAAIKRENGLKSNAIRAGKTLRIPSNQTQPKRSERYEYIALEECVSPLFHEFYSDKALDRIYLIPTQEKETKNLSGFVLENNRAGILYHNIGVNGAKLSDYLKYPLFFSQLKSLSPDLIVVSLGTNESFDKLTDADYKTQLVAFIENIKSENPDAKILMMTPPPSLFQRKFVNTFAAAYSKSILDLSLILDYGVWNLYTQFGGLYGVDNNSKRGLIGGDKVHYTKAGYELQAEMFVDALVKSFIAYKLLDK